MKGRNNWLLWLCFIGIFIPILMTLGPDFLAALHSSTWKRVPCKIVRSGVKEEPFSSTVMHYVVKTEYSSFFEDRAYKSTRFTPGKRQGSTDSGKAEKIAARLSPGSWSTCYVNPRHPE